MTRTVYRIESNDPQQGLWYNEDAEFVFIMDQLDNCPSVDIPMGYNERYRQSGHVWYSSVTDLNDFPVWFSNKNAYELMDRGFVLTKWVVNDYVDYEHETIFRKDSAVSREVIPMSDVFDMDNI